MWSSKGLLDNCEKALKADTLYMWGTYGSIITESLINAKVKQYPSHYTSARQKTLKSNINKAYGCDCAGLIKNYYFGGWGNVKYKSAYDLNVSGWLSKCTKTGAISSLPEVKGLALFMSGHIGVYAGDGYAYECTLGSHGDGVVKTKVSGRGWTKWGYLPEMSYEEVKPVTQNVIKVTTATLALRTEPSTKAGSRYLYIPFQSAVTVIEENVKENDGYMWDKVTYGGKTGYSANKYLKATKTKTTTAVLAMRSTPATGKGVRYCYIPVGTKVTVLVENIATSNGYNWDKVYYNNKEGYSANKYLK